MNTFDLVSRDDYQLSLAGEGGCSGLMSRRGSVEGSGRSPGLMFRGGKGHGKGRNARSPGLMPRREVVHYHVTYPMMHLMYLPPLPVERMTDWQTSLKTLPSCNFVCSW